MSPVRSMYDVPPSVVYCQLTFSGAWRTRMDGLILMEPVKFSEPVRVNCAGGSLTFITDATPDWVNVAVDGVIVFARIANAEEL